LEVHVASKCASAVNEINAMGIAESQGHYVEGNIPKGWAAKRAALKRGNKPGAWYASLDQTIEQLQNPNNQFELLFKFDVEKQADRLVGFTFVENLTPSCQGRELHAIYLHPDERRSGLGALLLKNMIERARQENCPRIILEVGPNNETAIHLYQRIGFRNYEELAPVPWGDSFLLLNRMELPRERFEAAIAACKQIIKAKQKKIAPRKEC
jgi:ribosomal protein S18 acetylase RimI-like enzyme